MKTLRQAADAALTHLKYGIPSDASSVIKDLEIAIEDMDHIAPTIMAAIEELERRSIKHGTLLERHDTSSKGME